MTTQGIINLGFYPKPEGKQGECCLCCLPLREIALNCADLAVCDHCGIVWQHEEGYLPEIGRREVKQWQKP